MGCILTRTVRSIDMHAVLGLASEVGAVRAADLERAHLTATSPFEKARRTSVQCSLMRL
jgi:hypothetical protein